jgi:hypothetical protein
MVFIEMFLKKNLLDLTKEDIESFVNRKVEENQNLDYKDIRKYYDFNGLSKHISSFANSSGGLLILGVSEEDVGRGKNLRIYPKEITWGDKTLSKETLENKLISRIQPPIKELRSVPVREGNGSKRLIFLFDIPKSKEAPHMAFNKQYYRRLNFRIIAMEHYEIANMFKANWITKQELVKEILIPLSSVLEKQAKLVEDYQHVYVNEIESVLAKTYYKMQISIELLDRIDHYKDVLNVYSRELQRVWRAIPIIVNRIVAELFEDDISLIEYRKRFNFITKSNNSEGSLDQNRIMIFLLKNQSLDIYLNDYVHEDETPHTIDVKYNQKTKRLSINDFKRLVWNRCLNLANKNIDINKIKETSVSLIEGAWDLIEELQNF